MTDEQSDGAARAHLKAIASIVGHICVHRQLGPFEQDALMAERDLDLAFSIEASDSPHKVEQLKRLRSELRRALLRTRARRGNMRQQGPCQLDTFFDTRS